MVLQYRGLKNNWCFEEADRITWANVNVSKETRDYRKGGKRHDLHLEDVKKKNLVQYKDKDFELEYVHEMHHAVDELIRQETGTSTDIVYLIGDKRFDELENVAVVMLSGKNIDVTYIFDMTYGSDCSVYILNSNGGTVQRIK